MCPKRLFRRWQALQLWLGRVVRRASRFARLSRAYQVSLPVLVANDSVSIPVIVEDVDEQVAQWNVVLFVVGHVLTMSVAAASQDDG